MKNTLLIIAVMVLSACASMPTMKSVAGTYERKKDGVRVGAYKQVFLDNGVIEYWDHGKYRTKEKWKIVDGEIHAKAGAAGTGVYRVNKDGSLTVIAWIRVVKRRDVPKEDQFTLKKIK